MFFPLFARDAGVFINTFCPPSKLFHSNTQTMNPSALGHDEAERAEKLVSAMDGYFDQGAHHLNVNVFGKDKLLDAMENPDKPEYANFTIRVSGYAVKFISLTREQQLDVINRTFHDSL